MSRYKRTTIFSNDEDYYSYLRDSRGIKRVTHFATPKIRNPTISERTGLVTTAHVWKYGDRLYNLAFKYLGVFWKQVTIVFID